MARAGNCRRVSVVNIWFPWEFGVSGAKSWPPQLYRVPAISCRLSFLVYSDADGRVAEWFKAPVLKTGSGASHS